VDGVPALPIQNEREWRDFCERFLGEPAVAGRPEFSTNARRNAHRDELGALIATRFASLTGDEATAALAAVPVAWARVNTMHDVWRHPQLAARERWHRMGTPNGPVPALAPPAFASPPRMDPVPDLGEHTRAILAGLGLPDDEIEALAADGVI
jgi:crotonobetainyl-CoA:carnitine CoA-transferase CaiB-like acyl-CoA transferase